jgi:hypothetical protein
MMRVDWESGAKMNTAPDWGGVHLQSDAAIEDRHNKVYQYPARVLQR